MVAIQYCEWLTGMPQQFYSLIVAIETHTGGYIEFNTNGYVSVDWGNDKFLTYEPGVVYGRQMSAVDDNGQIITGNPIIIKAKESAPNVSNSAPVTKLSFGDGASYDREYRSINIIKAVGLIDATKLCYRLEELREFKFFGNNKIKSFESAWEDCTELLKFDGMDTTRAVTMKRAWKNCNKLVKFPNIYATECLTVEEAWRGCTAMLEFPLVDLSNCRNFNSAWRGNENLRYFPFIDTGEGTKFDHAWSYCSRLSYFPELDFRKAKNMDYAFSFMRSIRNMPHIKSIVGETFRSTFKQMCSLKCIAEINTESIIVDETISNPTLEMFENTPILHAPTDEEQEQILEGYHYINSNPCYYNAGRSVFFVHIEAIPSYCSTIGFAVHGGDFEIDWGDGTYLPYNEGTIYNVPIENNGINIRSEEDITSIEFLTDVLVSIEFKRARTLTSFHVADALDPDGYRGMCEGLKTLEYFEIQGVTGVADYSKLLKNCTNLSVIGEIDLSKATSLRQMCFNNESLIQIGMRYYDEFNDEDIVDPLDMSSCLNFEEMFYGSSSIRYIQSCITPIGTNFSRMYANCFLLNCIDAVNTMSFVETSDMFDRDSDLIRPTKGEQNTILSGYDYNNGGSCGGPLAIIFRGIGQVVSFIIDAPVKVDWGDGNFIEYPEKTTISGTPFANTDAVIIGGGTTIDWQTDTIESMRFVRVQNIIDMSNMFENMSKLKFFVFSGESFATTFNSMFKNSGIQEFVGPPSLSEGKEFTSMFEGTSNLINVSPMNTENGLEFEYMFANSGLDCLGEINTLHGNFPPNTIECSSILDCDSSIACFGSSTMFLNTVPLNPTLDEIVEITSRDHWIGVDECIKETNRSIK